MHDQLRDAARGTVATKIGTAFQEPIELGADPDRANDDDHVQAKYDDVQESVQRGMDRLARRRRLPLFG